MQLAFKEIFEAPIASVPGINDEIRDLLLIRTHYIHRFENGTIGEMVSHYNDAKPQIMIKLANLQAIQDLGPTYTVATGRTTNTLQWRIDRLNSQLREVEMVLNNATDSAVRGLSYNLNQFAMNEKDYYENLLGSQFNKIGVNITRIPFEQVNQMLSMPLGGPTGAFDWQERFYERYRGELLNMRAALTQAVIQGDDMNKAARRLMGMGRTMGGELGNKIHDRASIIARTEIMRTSNMVQTGIYEANRDVLKGMEFISTLDDRTCLLPDSLIYTENGWKTIEKIQIGEKVLTNTGNYKKVTHKFKRLKNKYLKVKLSNGKELKITSDHKVLINEEWTEIGLLNIGDYIDGLSI